TAAIAAANASTAATRTIHVAAGTYNPALGERFPLQLRKISLVGAGATKTIIQGIGAFDHTALGGQFTQSIEVTGRLGDEAVGVDVSDLQVRAPADAVTNGSYGIFCDQGNAPNMTGAPPSPFLAPNLDISNVNLGPGLDQGLIITTSNGKSG